jgi:hypothetical protein
LKIVLSSKGVENIGVPPLRCNGLTLIPDALKMISDGLKVIPDGLEAISDGLPSAS